MKNSNYRKILLVIRIKLEDAPMIEGLRATGETPSATRVGAVINVEGVLIGVSDVVTSTAR